MQPPMRVTAGTSALAESTFSMDWTPLRQPGENGLVLVLMTLRWWGVQSQASSEWQEALADVSSAVFCMIDEDSGDIAVGRTAVKENLFKTLLAPGGQYPYGVKRKRKTTTSKPASTISKPKSSSNFRTSRIQRPGQHAKNTAPQRQSPPAKKPTSRASQRTIAAATASTVAAATATKKLPRHGWFWAPTTSSPHAGSAQADENEMPRETRSRKRMRVEGA